MWGDPAPGVSIGWRVRGSEQVLEDIGGRGRERGLGGWRRVWADLGENEGWRDPAHRGGRACGQIRGPVGSGRVRERRRTFRRVGGSPWGFGRV